MYDKMAGGACYIVKSVANVFFIRYLKLLSDSLCQKCAAVLASYVLAGFYD
jgi:hypothetical protein